MNLFASFLSLFLLTPFALANPSEELNSLKETLINRFQGTATPGRLSHSEVLSLHFDTSNHALDLEFFLRTDPLNREHTYSLILRKGTAQCGEISIDLTKSTGHIENIKTAYSCGLPSKGAGNAFLEIADLIAEALQLKSLSLVDSAKVQCEKSSKPEDLSRLYAIRTGKGWYESKGYTSIHHLSQATRIARFRNYPLETLTQVLAMASKRTGNSTGDENANPQSNLKLNQLRNALALFQTQSSEPSLHSYLTWLWTADCSIYQNVLSLLCALKVSEKDTQSSIFGENTKDLPQCFSLYGRKTKTF